MNIDNIYIRASRFNISNECNKELLRFALIALIEYRDFGMLTNYNISDAKTCVLEYFKSYNNTNVLMCSVNKCISLLDVYRVKSVDSHKVYIRQVTPLYIRIYVFSKDDSECIEFCFMIPLCRTPNLIPISSILDNDGDFYEHR